MSRIHRYVLTEMLGPTFVGFLAYGLILLMNLSLQAAEMAIRRDLPPALVLTYIVLSLPRISVLTLPMAVLVGVLIGVARLCADNEIPALRAVGYNDRRLVLPAALLGIVTAGITYVLYDMAVPAANYAQHKLQAQIFISSDLNREIQPRAFFEKIPDLLIYAEDANPADGTLRDVLIYQRDGRGEEEISTSRRARIDYDVSRGTLNFHLEAVVSHSWSRNAPDVYQLAQRDEETIVRPPDIFTSEMIRSLKEPPPPNLREQTVSQLLGTIEEFKKIPKGGARRRLLNEAWVEVHKKFAIPATCLVFAILGMPLALAQRRGGKAWGFVISILVIAIQYFLLTAGEQMADRGRIRPWVSMWVGNLAFVLLALLLLLLVGRWQWDPGALLALFRRGSANGPPARLPSPPPAPEAASDSTEAGGTGPPPTRESGPRRAPWRRWFPAVDRYLLKTLLPVAVLIGVSLALLFALFASLDLVDDMSRGGQPFSLLLHYLASILPQFVTNYVFPVTLCAATLITFALLSRTHELTTLRSAGVGPLRVSMVFVVVAALAAALSYGALDSVLPATNQKALQIRDQIRGRSPRSYKQPERRWVFGSRGELLTFSDFSRQSGEILDLGILRFRPGSLRIRERIFAERASWTPEGWLLSGGWKRQFLDSGETYEPFRRLLLKEMDGPEYFAQEWKAPDQMNVRDLRTYVADMERRGYDTRELRVGLHRKTALPAVCIVMVLIALPFGLRIERRGPLFGLGVALLLATAYYFMMQASGKLGEVGVLPPLLAAWAPNVLAGGSGLYLMASSRW